ncbi:MAG: hypothetical protein NTY39_03950 [Campylobacterales bacterium]|nr:hypothetical protein [Campylobacterales bacterium]
MNSINSNVSTGPEIYALKKAIEVQGQGLMKVLESAKVPVVQSAPVSSSPLTGLGKALDVRG